jgi:hypothetical protein
MHNSLGKPVDGKTTNPEEKIMDYLGVALALILVAAYVTLISRLLPNQ